MHHTFLLHGTRAHQVSPAGMTGNDTRILSTGKEIKKKSVLAWDHARWAHKRARAHSCSFPLRAFSLPCCLLHILLTFPNLQANLPLSMSLPAKRPVQRAPGPRNLSRGIRFAQEAKARSGQSTLCVLMESGRHADARVRGYAHNMR